MLHIVLAAGYQPWFFMVFLSIKLAVHHAAYCLSCRVSTLVIFVATLLNQNSVTHACILSYAQTHHPG